MTGNTCYIYLNGKSFDGTVFVTQIADWLSVFNDNDVHFEYFHVFPIQSITKRSWRRQQASSIKKVIPSWRVYSWSFPSRSLLMHINAFLWGRAIKRIADNSDRIVIFSRMLYGNEIKLLRKWFCVPIIFFYDARAASVEENRHNAIMGNYLTKKQFDMLSHISYTEYMTVTAADRIFSVSNNLKNYLIRNYGCSRDKFFIYPCLTDKRKFFYNRDLRIATRKELGFDESDLVLLYAGGLKNVYHVMEQTLAFLNLAAKVCSNVKVLLLSKDRIDNETILTKYPFLNGRFVNLSIPNQEMVRFLNAADYGLLFRDNVPMNNVASPSKFAEYMLCGLPTIISEGVGDYSDLCKKEDLGELISEQELSQPESIDFRGLLSKHYNREKIAEFGSTHFSKQSLINEIIKEFQLVWYNQ